MISSKWRLDHVCIFFLVADDDGEKERTVAAGCGLVVEVVPHDGGGLVEELCDLGVGLVLEAFGEEVGVVAAACLDQDFLDGGALCMCVSLECTTVNSIEGWTCVVLLVSAHLFLG